MTTDLGQNGQPKKKRGPKKKVWSAQMRQQRQTNRRNRANTRERQRMHGLNKSLDLLRSACPMLANQRLSKIDTLRLARNYIKALSQILENGQQPDVLDYARTLTKDLSQGTINLIAGHLQVSPHLLWYSEHVLYTSDSFMYPTLPATPTTFSFYNPSEASSRFFHSDQPFPRPPPAHFNDPLPSHSVPYSPDPSCFAMHMDNGAMSRTIPFNPTNQHVPFSSY